MRRKAEERATLARVAAVVAEAAPFGAVADVDPLQALRDLISHKHREVQFLRAWLADIPDEQRIWAETEHKHGLSVDGPVDVHTERATAHVVWVQLRSAEDQLARYTTEALRAGIAERELRLAESQAEQLAAVVLRGLAAAQLTPEQQDAARAAIAAELRQLEAVATPA